MTDSNDHHLSSVAEAADADTRLPARIGVIGDVHAEHEHLATALDFFDRAAVDLLLCTGDIVDGPGDVERCIAMLSERDVPTVRGNHERWLLTDKVRHIAHAHHRSALSARALEYLMGLPVQREFATSDGRLLLCHGVAEKDMVKVWPGTDRLAPQRSARLDALLTTKRFDWLINGHMHYRTLLHFDSLTLLNAGTLSRRHRPGLTLLNLEENRIEAFEFGEEGGLRQVLERRASATHEDPRWPNSEAFCGSRPPVVLYAPQSTSQ